MGKLLEVFRSQGPYDLDISLHKKLSEGYISGINGRESEAKPLLSCVQHLMLLLYRKVSSRNAEVKNASIMVTFMHLFFFHKKIKDWLMDTVYYALFWSLNVQVKQLGWNKNWKVR